MAPVDPAWEYATRVENDKDAVVCNLCGRTTRGGITRFKQHIVGGYRNATMCTKTTQEIRDKFQAILQAAKEKRANRNAFHIPNQHPNVDNDIPSNTDFMSSGGQQSSRSFGPMDRFTSSGSGSRVNSSNAPQQTTLNAHFKKDQRELACQQFCRWLYQAGIPFNTLRKESFKEAMATISQFGPGFKPPSYYEARVKYLNMEVEYTRNLMAHHRDAWEKYGCSIMSDGWKDVRRRPIINFLVHSTAGTMFIKSVDASNVRIDGITLYNYLDEIIEEVGAKNVVQIVTDNASNYVSAKAMLKSIYPHILMTPCAAHCLDLVLEDVSKEISLVKQTCARAQATIVFIYNHGSLLALLRQCTDGKDLARPGVTRFATVFLTLQSILNERNTLRKMFTSDEWSENKLSKTSDGKKVTKIVLSSSFWTNIQTILTLTAPIVQMLRKVDGDEPTMGYIYDAFLRAKYAIETAFANDALKSKLAERVANIFEKRWEDKMSNKLYLTAMFLSPNLFFGSRSFMQNDEDINQKVYDTLKVIVQDNEEWTKVIEDVATYRLKERSFGSVPARQHMQTMHPARWWMNYGSSAPNLQCVAIRILNLTTSSSGCEQNWSFFEHLHSKRRNRLEQKRLNDMVFIKYNQTLHERHMNSTLDPLEMEDIDDCNEWIANLDLSKDCTDGGLTWGMVEIASGLVDEDEGPSTRASRRKDKGKTKVSNVNEISYRQLGDTYLDDDDEEEYNFDERVPSNQSGDTTFVNIEDDEEEYDNDSP